MGSKQLEWQGSGDISGFTLETFEKQSLKRLERHARGNITIIKIQTQTTLSLKIYNGTGEGMHKVLNCSCLQNSIQQTQNDIE